MANLIHKKSVLVDTLQMYLEGRREHNIVSTKED